MAVSECIREDICEPILLGDEQQIEKIKKELALSFDCEIIDPKNCVKRLGLYSNYLFEKEVGKELHLLMHKDY